MLSVKHKLSNQMLVAPCKLLALFVLDAMVDHNQISCLSLPETGDMPRSGAPSKVLGEHI